MNTLTRLSDLILPCLQTAKNSASTRQSQDLQDELAALKKQIANKEQDIQKIRREAGQNEGAFDELSAAVSDVIARGWDGMLIERGGRVWCGVW